MTQADGATTPTRLLTEDPGKRILAMCKSSGSNHEKKVIKVGRWNKTSKSFAEVCPKAAREAVGWDPRAYASMSNARVKWQCFKCGLIYEAKINTHTKGHGCPVCNHKKHGLKRTENAIKKNNFAKRFPALAKECDGTWDPRRFSASSHSKVGWICGQCRINYEASISNRSRNGSGCPECGKKKQVASFLQNIAKRNNLAKRFPDLVKECDGTWDPKNFSARSGQKVGWNCSQCGFNYSAHINARTQGSGCPECGKKKHGASWSASAAKRNNLAKRFPGLVKECDGTWDPNIYACGAKVEVGWVCGDCGLNYKMFIYSRTSRGSGCPDCAKNKTATALSSAAAKTNNFAKRFPKLAKECDGTWNPKDFACYTRIKVGWNCQKCGLNYRMEIANRTFRGSGCPDCNSGGYNSKKSGYLYYLECGSRRKYGITNNPDDRINRRHKRNGFTLIEVIGPFCGKAVEATERLIKQTLKEKKIATGKKAFRSFFDGWTESFNHQDLPANSIMELFSMLGIEPPSFLSA